MLKPIAKSGLVWGWVALLVILCDRLVKAWALQHLTLYDPLPILPFFNLTLAHNTGAAFSFLDSHSGWQHYFLGGLAVCVSLVLIVWLAKRSARDVILSIALSLIIGGAIGNVLDRILYGYVVDMFDFHLGTWHFAIFNVADSAICVGGFLLVVHWWLESRHR